MSRPPAQTGIKRPRLDEAPTLTVKIGSVSADPAAAPPRKPPACDVSVGGVVGNNTALHKVFVRPSSAPDAKHVRPPEVVEAAFFHWLAAAKAGKSTLVAVHEQLQSMRQDLAVQRIEDSFAASVYECHARCCIAVGDLMQFGACLGNIMALHRQGITGWNREELTNRKGFTEAPDALLPARDVSAVAEFTCYRVVYKGLVALGGEDDTVAQELSMLEKRQPELLEDPAVQWGVHAVGIKGNALSFRAHMLAAPSPVHRRLLALFVQRLRLDWLRTLVMGFNGFVPGLHVAHSLGVDTLDQAGAVLIPVVGAAQWGVGDARGLNCTSSRRAVLSHVEQLTKQRPDGGGARR